MVKPILLLLALLPLLAQAAPTEVKASVDPNPVTAGNATTLEVTANDDLPQNALDTKPLQKDFVVGNISVSRATQITNLNVNRQTRWQISLIAQKPGQYTIPPLAIGDLRTAAITLRVEKPGKAQSRNLLLETQLSDTQVYPGAQVNYHVKLLVGQDLKSGKLSDPSLDSAELRRIGDDKESTEQQGGRSYHTFERNYALFAKQTGTFVIQPPVFNGQVFTQDSRGFVHSRDVGKVGAPKTLIVLPIPDPDKPWLPARDLTLEERWSVDPKHWRVGQPVTRTLVLTAKGTQATSLPNITMPVPQGLKSYPDQTDRKSYLDDGWLTAQETSSVALVPSQDGTLTLPAIDITWFDTLARQYRVATIPARTVNIAKAPVTESRVQLGNVPVRHDAGWWPYLSALLALAWLSTLYLWLKPRLAGKNISPEQAERLLPSWLALRQAVLSDDPQQAYSALHQWAYEHWQVNSLDALAAFYQHPPLSKAIAQLQQARFAKTPVSWQGKPLWQALQQARPPSPPPPGSGLYAKILS